MSGSGTVSPCNRHGHSTWQTSEDFCRFAPRHPTFSSGIFIGRILWHELRSRPHLLQQLDTHGAGRPVFKDFGCLASVEAEDGSLPSGLLGSLPAGDAEHGSSRDRFPGGVLKVETADQSGAVSPAAKARFPLPTHFFGLIFADTVRCLQVLQHRVLAAITLLATMGPLRIRGVRHGPVKKTRPPKTVKLPATEGPWHPVRRQGRSGHLLRTAAPPGQKRPPSAMSA